MRDELQYIINEEKRTVTCIAWDCENDLIEHLLKKSSDSFTLDTLVHNYETLLLKHKYVGTAKCSPEDTFDVEIGKKIARAKMREKYTRDKFKAIDNFMFILEPVVNLFNDAYNAVINSYDKNADILQEYGVSVY